MGIKVNLKRVIDDSYSILIGEFSLKEIAKQIVKEKNSSYCIVTDSNLKKVYGTKLLVELRKNKVTAELISFSAGEQNKNLLTFEKILEEMISKGFDRKSCVVALGGGITGDLAGFVASSYMRGISLIQIPTTLLSMVDSSVGGKTGVNLSKGKNSVGSFYQPKKVIINTVFLNSLGEREIKSGLSEVVKYAIISDAKFFDFLEKNIEKVLQLDKKTLEKVIKRNCELKARVIEKDEKEQGIRKILNYGHTIGHALEILGKYSKFNHGEAIAIGMICEAKISNALGFMNEKEVEKIIKLFEKIGLPTKIPKNFNSKKIILLTKKDKKSFSGNSVYSLPSKIGKIITIKKNYSIIVKDVVALKAVEECK